MLTACAKAPNDFRNLASPRRFRCDPPRGSFYSCTASMYYCELYRCAYVCLFVRCQRRQLDRPQPVQRDASDIPSPTAATGAGDAADAAGAGRPSGEFYTRPPTRSGGRNMQDSSFTLGNMSDCKFVIRVILRDLLFAVVKTNVLTTNSYRFIKVYLQSASDFAAAAR